MSRKIIFGCISIFLFNDSLFAHRALVEARNQSILSSELAAKVIKIPYRNGESFAKGAVLIEYDCDLIKTQKDKIDAELVGVKIKADSYEEMVKLNSMGELDATLARSEAKKKEAELKMAEITVSKCQVKAPYDGKVLKTIVREYEYVGEQKELMEIVGTKNLEVSIILPSKMITSVSIGQKVSFVADETGTRAEGNVVGISPSADPVSQTFRVRASLNSFGKHLLPGTIGNAQFGAK
jgi:RND family efflux transporter MFP subunit